MHCVVDTWEKWLVKLIGLCGSQYIYMSSYFRLQASANISMNLEIIHKCKYLGIYCLGKS